MIFDALIMVMVRLTHTIMSVLPTAELPSVWSEMFSWTFNTIWNWDWLVPLPDLVQAAQTVVAFELVLFVLRLGGVGIAIVRGVRVFR